MDATVTVVACQHGRSMNADIVFDTRADAIAAITALNPHIGVIYNASLQVVLSYDFCSVNEAKDVVAAAMQAAGIGIKGQIGSAAIEACPLEH